MYILVVANNLHHGSYASALKCSLVSDTLVLGSSGAHRGLDEAWCALALS